MTDHIGTVTELVSERGNIEYQQHLSLWGEADFRLNRSLNAKTQEPLTCRLRFAGQYADDESGLYYNRHRYYNPAVGQYISPDPIGLLGGFNPYGYVGLPTEWVDPLGLKPCPRIVNGTKIYGKGQKDGTPGHNQFSEVIANKLAMSGKFEEIYLNRSYNTALGQGGANRPDVLAIDRNGRVHSIELASKTDMGRKLPSLTTRNSTVIKSLPPSQRGRIVVLKHPYKASDIKHAVNQLIGEVK